MSEFKAGFAASRTRHLSDAMQVSKDLMWNLLLPAGGRGGISSGGGGSNSELINRDGTKEMTGRGISIQNSKNILIVIVKRTVFRIL